MFAWLERLYRELARGSRPADHPLWRGLLELMHVVVVTVREARRDRLPVRAATLAYWTAVAIVPILLLGFTLTGSLGLTEGTRDAVRRLLYHTVLADSIEDVGDALDTLLAGANLSALGIVGVATVMLVGAQLYFNAEQAYNDIFQTRLKRSFLLRITLFYAGITLAPTFIAAGFVATAMLPGQVNLFGRVLPVMLTATALVGAIRLLPCRDVSWKASLVGGVFSALAFELAKAGFGTYTDIMGTRDSLAGIYGSLAFLPVFLLWLYVLWLVVLVGVELAWLVEHYEVLIGAQRRAVTDPFDRHRHPDALFALGLMGMIARHWLDGLGPISVDRLVQESGADPRHVRAALDVLEDTGLLMQSEDKRYLPAQPPQSLTGARIIAAWRQAVAPPVSEDAPLHQVIRRASTALEQVLDQPGAWIPGPGAEIRHLRGVDDDRRVADHPPGA
ncbi:MAG: YihY/virulence factor BrkB family protein [Deltaproteobacteria bacterium]|nr:MAG: YihY/virulence factor BrkB family protein [Deltaproteobacteria bacterium]